MLPLVRGDTCVNILSVAEDLWFVNLSIKHIQLLSQQGCKMSDCCCRTSASVAENSRDARSWYPIASSAAHSAVLDNTAAAVVSIGGPPLHNKD